MHNYKELKYEITEKVTNHTSKLIDNLENKFRQINENIERKQEEAKEMMFNRLERTIDDINRQNNPRTENRQKITIYKIIDNKKIVHKEIIQSQLKKKKKHS